MSVADVYTMSDRDCLNFLVTNRFGSWNQVVCPHCNTTGKHYFNHKPMRWKCLSCRSSFSITSGTLFHAHKLSLKQIIAAMLSWVNLNRPGFCGGRLV